MDETKMKRKEGAKLMMGFAFNEAGELRDENGDRFVYGESTPENKQRFNNLVDMITEYIYELLETDYQLHRIHLPVDARVDEPKSFIFVSKDALETSDKLLILIHGSGYVKAGQWSRSLYVEESLDKGTQLPYIRRAVELGYEIMLLNTNLNTDGQRKIRGSESAEDHAVYVWENIIEKQVKAQHIAIVAHSAGGVYATQLANTKSHEFLKRVFAVAFTDSVHSYCQYENNAPVCKFYTKHVRNWVSCNEPLDVAVGHEANDAPRVSAGTRQHVSTSWSSMDSVFKFLQEQYQERISQTVSS